MEPGPEPTKFSVVIPVYNEAESLASLHARVLQTMDKIASSCEVIYVNDGSTDASLETLEGLVKASSACRVVSYGKNRGQSAALWTGFWASRGSWIITLDADLQNPPEEILKLTPFMYEFDFITGVRVRRSDPFLRRATSKVARLFRAGVLGDATKDVGCSLRLFKRDVIIVVPAFRNFHRFFTFLALRAGFRIKEVEVAHEARRYGASKYGVLRRAGQGLWDLVGVFWLKGRILNRELFDLSKEGRT